MTDVVKPARYKYRSEALALYTHKPSKPVIIFGKKCVFSGYLTFYMLIAFASGWLDVHTLDQFGVYVTMSTGNIVSAAIATASGEFSEAGIKYISIVGNVFLGVILSCHLLERTQSRKKAFEIIVLMTIVSIIVTEVIEKFHMRQEGFCVILLATVSGAVLHLVLKLGFTTSLMTVNFLKISESFYRLWAGVHQGGAKLRGDAITILSIFFSFLGGTFVSAGISHYVDREYTILPIIFLNIMQLLLVNGVFHKEKDFLADCPSIFGDLMNGRPIFVPSPKIAGKAAFDEANRNVVAGTAPTSPVAGNDTTNALHAKEIPLSVRNTMESSNSSITNNEMEDDLDRFNAMGLDMLPSERETMQIERNLGLRSGTTSARPSSAVFSAKSNSESSAKK